jgi:hypothetical protein
VVELDDGHGDGGDQKMIKCFTFRKEKREKQKWILTPLKLRRLRKCANTTM